MSATWRAQLVENPNDAAVFLPRLLPGLEKVSQEVPDPECRTVAAKARDTLLKLMPEGDAPAEPEAHDFKVGGATSSPPHVASSLVRVVPIAGSLSY